MEKILEKYDDGSMIVEVPMDELVVEDVSEKNIERMARGFILGSQAIGRKKEVRQHLEKKVTERIGRKGKYLMDKLFELIEGVYVMERKAGRDIRYYQVPPNLNAIVYALDRALGKPKQYTEVTEEKKGIMVVEHIIKNLAGDAAIQDLSNKIIAQESRKEINGGTNNGGQINKRGRGRPRIYGAVGVGAGEKV